MPGDKKISELDAMGTVGNDDQFPIIQSGSGPLRTRAAQFLGDLPKSPATRIVAATDTPNSEARADFICDGVADEVQINSAIGDLSASGGKVILLEGTYTLSAPIVVDASNIVFTAVGGALITLINGVDDSVVEVGDGVNPFDNILVTGLQIDGNAAGQAGTDGRNGITVNANVTNVIIRGNLIEDVKFDGILIQSDGTIVAENIIDNCGEGILIFGCDHVSVSHNHITNIIDQDGIEPSNAKYTQIIGNYIDTCVQTGIDIFNGSIFCVVQSNIVRNCSAGGIQTDSGSHLALIANNLVEDCIGFHGIYVQSNSCNIVGNMVVDCAEDGIRVFGGDNQKAVITDNTVIDCDRHGINMLASSRNLVQSNFVSHNCQELTNTFSEIMLDDDAGVFATSNVVRGNYIYSFGATRAAYGVREDAAGDDFNVIEDNFLSGPLTANISIQGPNTILGRNRGWTTENSGTATILNGNTSIAVNHGLAVTPTLQDITVVLGENPTNDPGNIWISALGAAQFTINCRNDPGVSNLDLAWQAIVL